MQIKRYLHSFIILATFIGVLKLKPLLPDAIVHPFSGYMPKVMYYYLWWIVPAILVTGVLYGFKDLAKNLGLSKGFGKGLLFAFVMVLPMLISSAITGKINSPINGSELIHHTLFAGFMEEFLFRAFLFGLLFRKVGWGFIHAALLGAISFGLGHLYQGDGFGEALGVFAVTAAGALWFAWLYIEWKGNLWVPIFLHVFMNLSWNLFAVSETALGGSSTNIFRAMTIALSIILTIRIHKKENLQIRRSCLWVNPNKEA